MANRTANAKWSPPGKAYMSYPDGSRWKLVELRNGCNVHWGCNKYGIWSSTCTTHGVLPVLIPNSEHNSWKAIMNHKTVNGAVA